MTPELVGIIALFGSVIALAVALFGTLKWLADRMDKRFDRIDDRFERVDDRFERVESELSKLKEGLFGVKEGQARLEGMFEGAFERGPGMAARKVTRSLLRAAAVSSGNMRSIGRGTVWTTS